MERTFTPTCPYCKSTAKLVSSSANVATLNCRSCSTTWTEAMSLDLMRHADAVRAAAVAAQMPVRGGLDRTTSGAIGQP